jgi:hypothetical protein
MWSHWLASSFLHCLVVEVEFLVAVSARSEIQEEAVVESVSLVVEVVMAVVA